MHEAQAPAQTPACFSQAGAAPIWDDSSVWPSQSLSTPSQISLGVLEHCPQAFGEQHRPLSQAPDWQSFVPLQLLPSQQVTQLPPQSTSLSDPFFFPSSQLMQAPCSQLLEAQSLAKPQLLPSGQSWQGPPQSTSDSPWFFTSSAQVGSLQTPKMQVTLRQSAWVSQKRPLAQALQGPPQSTSDSPPFFSPSSQLAGAAQRP